MSSLSSSLYLTEYTARNACTELTVFGRTERPTIGTYNCAITTAIDNLSFLSSDGRNVSDSSS